MSKGRLNDVELKSGFSNVWIFIPGLYWKE